MVLVVDGDVDRVVLTRRDLGARVAQGLHSVALGLLGVARHAVRGVLPLTQHAVTLAAVVAITGWLTVTHRRYQRTLQ